MEDADEVVDVSELDFSFRDEVASMPGGENIKRCFACGTCAAGCPITEVDEEYNCRRLIRKILLGMREEVLSSSVIWLCLECYRCYARCPQKVNFTDVMRILRYLAIKNHHIAPETLARVKDIDNFVQIVRRDLVRHGFQPLEGLTKKLQSMIAEKIEEKPKEKIAK